MTALPRRFLAAASLLAAMLATIVTPPLAAQADPPAPDTVVFEDDFTGSANASFDTAKWEDFSTATYDSTAAFGSIGTGDNETLDGNGHLVIPATTTAGSAIRSKFTFQYGTFSAWAKLPSQAGYWPAFWSLNNDTGGGAAHTWDPVGEVDAMETYTTWTDVYHAAGHTWTGASETDYHGADNRCPAAENADLDGTYNKFTARIEPNRVSYYFNDAPCGASYWKDAQQTWGFGPDVTDPNWLILDLAVGGGGQSAPTSNAQMLVDRVEVRSLPTAPFVSEGTYKLVNACGSKVLEVPGGSTTNTEPLKTGTYSSAAYQKWTITYEDEGFYKLVNVNSSLAANVDDQSTANGANIIQYTDNGGPNAEFDIQDAGSGYFNLVARHSGKAVGVASDSSSAGASITQWERNTNCGQKWQIATP